MAKFIPVRGNITDIKPTNEKIFTLDELQKLVDGDIELIYLPNYKIMVVNEDGMGAGKDFNVNASIMCNLPVVGDVVVLDRKEFE